MANDPPSQWWASRDWALLGLLAVLNVGSAYTTVEGARQVFPAAVADSIGLAVQAVLFLLLAGVVLAHAPGRKWLAVSIFAVFSVYTSFFAYYGTLAGQANAEVAMDRALAAHAALVGSTLAPVQAQADRLAGEARAAQAEAEREATAGSGTGLTGWGPVARQHAARAAALRGEVDALAAQAARLEGAAGEVGGSPAEAYRSAVRLAAAAGVAAPPRDAFVDRAESVGFLLPLRRVAAGEGPAGLALVLALVVDGLSILLGTAIVVKPRARRVKPPGVEGLDPAWLRQLYRAIDPETGEIEDPDVDDELAGRMALDQLREVGWMDLDGGAWSVPIPHIDDVLGWLRDQIGEPVGRTGSLRVVGSE